jgi:soluble cytochrome b562
MELEDRFNKFIKDWCGKMSGHLLDSDENDGQRFRDAIWNEQMKVYRQGAKELIERIYEDDQFWKEPLECIEKYLKLYK